MNEQSGYAATAEVPEPTEALLDCDNQPTQVTEIFGWSFEEEAAKAVLRGNGKALAERVAPAQRCAEKACEPGLCAFDWAVAGITTKKLEGTTEGGNTFTIWVAKGFLVVGCWCAV